MSVAIKIENLSKQYRLGLVSTRTLSHNFLRKWAGLKSWVQDCVMYTSIRRFTPAAIILFS